MNCIKVQSLLAGFLDNMISVKQHILIEKHTQECPNCRDALYKLEAYKKVVNSITFLESSRDFTQVLLKRIEMEPKSNTLWQNFIFIWENFWSSKLAVRLSYGMAAVVFLFVTFVSLQLINEDKNQSQNPVASSNIMESSNPVPVVLPPVSEEKVIKGYRFDFNSNKVSTVLVNNGEEMLQNRIINEDDYEQIFAQILFNRAIFEKKLQNHPIAQNLFNRIINNKYINDSAIKEKARMELVQYSSSSN